MRRIVSLPVLAAFVVLGASCSQQVQQPVKKAVPPPVYVGKVEQVYPNHHYVLIALAGNVYEPCLSPNLRAGKKNAESPT